MENSSEIWIFRHLPTFQPIAFQTSLLLFFFPSAAVAKEVLPCLGRRSSAPPTLVVFSVSEAFQVYSCGCMPGL
jgi:hypothetical protein